LPKGCNMKSVLPKDWNLPRGAKMLESEDWVMGNP
jgi:hypothetical protein